MNGPAATALLRRLAAGIAAVFTLLLAILVVMQAGRHTQLHTEYRLRLGAYLDGSADRPFVARVLVPESVRLLERLTPESVRPSLDRPLSFAGRPILPANLPSDASRLAYNILFAIQVAALAAWGFLGGALFRRLHPAGAFHFLVPPALVAIFIPFLEKGTAHLYDFTTPLFGAALLLSLAAGRERLYFLVFAVACYHKETAILTAFAWGAWEFDRLPRRRWFAGLAAQGGIFLFVFATVRLRFLDNGGGWISVWTELFVRWLLSRSFTDLATFLVIVALLSWRWSDQPLLLRRSALMLVPHGVLLAISAGDFEWRNLYESLPLLSMLLLGNLARGIPAWVGGRGTGGEATGA